MFDFTDKVAVITGGAQGIGKCIADEFKKYNKDEHPSYYNYDGIDVDKIDNIPDDYYNDALVIVVDTSVLFSLTFVKPILFTLLSTSPYLYFSIGVSISSNSW